jgi:hypothetical protein
LPTEGQRSPFPSSLGIGVLLVCAERHATAMKNEECQIMVVPHICLVESPVSMNSRHVFAASQYHNPCLMLVVSRSLSWSLYHVKKQHCCSVILHYLPVVVSVFSRALCNWRFEFFCVDAEHALIPICQVSAAVDFEGHVVLALTSEKSTFFTLL